MQAISVHFVPPTNFKGARWRVRCAAFSFLVNYEHSHASGEDGAWEAAAEGLRRFDERCQRQFARTGWGGDFVGGQTHDGTYVFVPILGTRERPSGIEGAHRFECATEEVQS